MSVTGRVYDRNSGVIRVTLTTKAQLHPLSKAKNAAQNYYCLALDNKGFQVEVDLQALPPGVKYTQLAPGQVWWVEKRTTLYRLYLYGGVFDKVAKQVNSTVPLPVNPDFSIPPGTLLDFASTTVPSGFLACDGSSYSTTTYSGLFGAIGYAWGGTGATFEVPDLRGLVTVGAGQRAGLTNRVFAVIGGEESHILSTAETPLAAHTHTFTVPAQTNLTTNTGTSSSVSLNTAAGSTQASSTSTMSLATTVTTTAAGTASLGVESASHAHYDTGHSHNGSNTGYNFMINNSAGAFTIGTGSSKIAQDTGTNTASANIGTETANHTHTDSGHTHTVPAESVTGSITIPSLTVNTMAVTGSVSIPGLVFTVPAQSALSTNNNNSTTATGHNNMQPYAVVAKIIKY